MRSVFFIVFLSMMLSSSTHAFVPLAPSSTLRLSSPCLSMSSPQEKGEGNTPTPEQLGFSGPSAQQLQEQRAQDELSNQKVRVDLVDDVDSVTLTAVGFAAIAFNFLVLANMGDGGIAGIVATIINTLNQ